VEARERLRQHSRDKPGDQLRIAPGSLLLVCATVARAVQAADDGFQVTAEQRLRDDEHM
jgi:hypothetical protein